jgi:Fe-S-cluster containining protein
MVKKVVPIRIRFDCSKCPGYCCTYEHIPVTKRDIARLAKHFDLSYAAAEKRFTKPVGDGIGMRHRTDDVYKSSCMMLDREKRNCTIYDARPAVCRSYPDGAKCGYYDFLKFERDFQDDETFVPSA